MVSFEHELKNAYIGGDSGFEYNYDFRNKTLSQIQTDGWTSYDKTPAFDSDGMYCTDTSTASTIRIKNALWNDLNNAKKITIKINYKWNSVYAGARIGVIKVDDVTNINTVYMQGTARQIQLGDGIAYSINNAPDTAGTYSETFVLDLINKTYSATGHFNYSGTLTDAQINYIKATTGLRVCGYRANGVRIVDFSLTIEY